MTRERRGDTVSELPMWTVSPAAYAATREKVEKINERARKRGFTGRIDLIAEPFEQAEENEAGFNVTRSMFRVALSGQPPRYEGWSFLATLNWDQHAGLVVRAAPGAPPVDRATLVEGRCDHCHTVRQRRKVYLVRNEQGEQIQVGSTCIKDFLGWSAGISFIDEESVREDIDGFLTGLTGGERDYRTEDVLAIAWAAIQVEGFRPSNSEGWSTKGQVQFVLDPPPGERTREEEVFLATIREHVEPSRELGRKVREFILSDEFAGSSDYVKNLKAIVAAEYVSWSNLGFVASAPQAYARWQERTLIRQAEKRAPSQWVGQPGDRLTLDLEIKAIRYIEGDYGVTTLYTFVDGAGNQFKWFSSRGISVPSGWKRSRERLPDIDYGRPAEAGDKVKLAATVKGHDEWKGHKQTVLTRGRVI